MKKIIREWILFILFFCVVGVFIYGVYFTFKKISYAIFYKDMVNATIVETIKPECMRGQ